jgi:hypothetical protein
MIWKILNGFVFRNSLIWFHLIFVQLLCTLSSIALQDSVAVMYKYARKSVRILQVKLAAYNTTFFIAECVVVYIIGQYDIPNDPTYDVPFNVLMASFQMIVATRLLLLNLLFVLETASLVRIIERSLMINRQSGSSEDDSVANEPPNNNTSRPIASVHDSITAEAD